MSEPAYLDQGATFDETRRYRYRLWRVWDPGLPRVAFVMLNPSTADETVLDPTLRRCLGFALAWGCGSFEVGNLYGLRSTAPAGLWKVADPVGRANDHHLEQIAQAATLGVVAGWGNNAEPARARDVLWGLERYANVYHLGLTGAGQPRHPLYLKRTTERQLLRGRRPA